MKEIDNFNYDHSEDLGNAFEYLLSVLGSQGDAGQFRTPRHIIDFIVEIVDPKKNETVLDPACGTAGFLISAYKHIRKHNSSNFKVEKEATKEKLPDAETSAETILTGKIYRGDLLTPNERKKLMNNFVGYDISPDMVKLSLVNMYLHGFQAPKIYEYDTLTSEKHWGEQFDVIMANPPFMSPKGGIRPHKRFSVQASRSEVLFVDYILEHLNLKGRAGIIVPEGIIFKTENAYKQLRQKLCEDGLFAVVSLPPGVFNPYSGVKTSILLFDNQLAKKTDEILFLKIENDGFDLGAQRRKIDKNDLPEALNILDAWKQGKKKESGIALWVKKEKIAESGDYNLTGERYKETNIRKNQKWALVEIGEIAELGRGRVISKDYIHKNVGPYPVYSSQTQNNGEFGSIKTYDFEGEHVTWTTDGANAGRVFYRNGKFNCTNVCGTIKIKDPQKVSPKYLAYVLNTRTKPFVSVASGNPKLMNNVMAKIKIPLPPLEVQKEIVEQIEVKQNAINHAKEIIKNLERERRYFGQELRKLDDIELVELRNADLFKIESGGTPDTKESDYWNGDINWATLVDLPPENYITEMESTKRKITEKGLAKSSAVLLPANTILVSSRATIGRVAIAKNPTATNQGFKNIIVKDKQKILPFFVAMCMTTKVDEMNQVATGGTFKEIPKSKFEKLKIPLPPLEIQKQLVAETGKEEEIIASNRRLIDLMERKIDEVLSDIY